jgi:hypothetical protein
MMGLEVRAARWAPGLSCQRRCETPQIALVSNSPPGVWDGSSNAVNVAAGGAEMVGRGEFMDPLAKNASRGPRTARPTAGESSPQMLIGGPARVAARFDLCKPRPTIIAPHEPALGQGGAGRHIVSPAAVEAEAVRDLQSRSRERRALSSQSSPATWSSRS